MINYYHILGLSESASSGEIKAAFKSMALRYHPDKHQGDAEMEERFKEVNQAYQVLSNPYEKARYDILRQYGQVHHQQMYETPPAPKPAPRPKYRRPNYKEPEIDWKENWKATAYAFGFTFILASIVMAGIGIKDYFDVKALKEMLAERRAAFEQARSRYRLGEIGPALKEINELSPFFDSEEDMRRYKEELYNSFLFEGTHSYNKGDYTEAIYYYELIEEYAERKPPALKENLALAYKSTNQPYKSLKKFKELLITGHRQMEIYIRMAEIHRDHLHEKEEAKRYLEIASDLAIERYEAIYGNAYPLILTGKALPPDHYYLYTWLADIYLETEDFGKAVKATKWNIRMWPDSTSNYIIAAKGYEKLGNKSKACEYFQIARTLGYREAVGFRCP